MSKPKLLELKPLPMILYWSSR